MTQKMTEAEQVELKLDSYLMYIHRTSCTRCNSGEQYNTLYEVWVHPTKTRTSGFRDLRPMSTAALKDVPLAYVDLPHRLIPICSDCITNYTSPTAQQSTPAATAAAWADTLRRKYTPEKPEIKIARASSDKTIPAPTPDQL